MGFPTRANDQSLVVISISACCLNQPLTLGKSALSSPAELQTNARHEKSFERLKNSPRKINAKKLANSVSKPTHIILKLLKTKEKEKTTKAVR